MSSVLSSAHVHTNFCDGKNPAGDMAKRAWELGFISLGFSSHAPQDFDFPCCVRPEWEAEYKAVIRSLTTEYEGRMTIYLGIERDHYACVSPADYDYFISSVHYLKHEGGYCAIDGDAEELRRYVEAQCGGDGLMMARRYFELLRDDVLDTHAPIIGHFDLVRKNNARLRLYDEDSPVYQNIALEALEALKDSGALLEVNTGAMARGYLTTPYPAPFLLKAWKNWGGEVMINSDCHDLRYLDYAFDDAESLLRSLGYDHAVRLGKNALWERFSL